MNQLKYSMGPFDLFSSIIAGLPLVFAAYLLNNPQFQFIELLRVLKENSSFTFFFLIGILSYLSGAFISRLTWPIYVFTCKIFRKDYRFIQKALLGNLDQIGEKGVKLTADEFASLSFEDRLAYMVVNRVGNVTYSWINQRLLPYIWENTTAIGAKVDTYLAMHIMYRNLSLGFFIVSLLFIRAMLLEDQLVNDYTYYFALSITLSVLSFTRADNFREWRYREILIGFYHAELPNYLTLESKGK